MFAVQKIQLSDEPSWLEFAMPLQFWAVFWFLLAGICLLSLFMKKIKKITIGLTVILMSMWATSVLTSESVSAPMTSILYFTIVGLLIWGISRVPVDMEDRQKEFNENFKKMINSRG